MAASCMAVDRASGLGALKSGGLVRKNGSTATVASVGLAGPNAEQFLSTATPWA